MSNQEQDSNVPAVPGTSTDSSTPQSYPRLVGPGRGRGFFNSRLARYLQTPQNSASSANLSMLPLTETRRDPFIENIRKLEEQAKEWKFTTSSFSAETCDELFVKCSWKPAPGYDFTKPQELCDRARTLEYRRMFGPEVVVIQGNIGSGKTTLIRRLEEILTPLIRCEFTNEPSHHWTSFAGHNLLKEAYNDPTKTFTLQNRVLQTYHDIEVSPFKQGSFLRVMDRSFYTANVFIKVLTERNILTHEQKSVLDEWMRILRGSHITPTSVIYIRTPPHVCLERIRMRGRDGENNISLPYLEALHEAHDQAFNPGNSYQSKYQLMYVINGLLPVSEITRQALYIIKKRLDLQKIDVGTWMPYNCLRAKPGNPPPAFPPLVPEPIIVRKLRKHYPQFLPEIAQVPPFQKLQSVPEPTTSSAQTPSTSQPPSSEATTSVVTTHSTPMTHDDLVSLAFQEISDAAETYTPGDTYALSLTASPYSSILSGESPSSQTTDNTMTWQD